MALTKTELAFYKKISNNHDDGAGRPVCWWGGENGRCNSRDLLGVSLRDERKHCTADDCAACQQRCTGFKLDEAKLRKQMIEAEV